MNKTIQVTIEGQDYRADFGRMWFTKLFRDNAGFEPLAYPEETMKDSSKLFDYMVNLIYSGIQADEKHRKVSEAIQKADVENYIGGLDDAGIADLLRQFVAIVSPVKEGELEAQGEKKEAA